MVDRKEKSAANAVHEESSIISKRLRSEAMEEGIDIILDGVADGTLEARKQVYEEFKEYGYYIRMDYVTLDTNESLKIAEIREEQTGRHVPPTFIKDMNKIIALLVPDIIKYQLFDEFYLWDTNIKDNPRLILSQKSRN
jgi:predicted ABC-type ATPase